MTKQTKQIQKALTGLTYRDAVMCLLYNLSLMIKESQSTEFRDVVLDLVTDFEIRERLKHLS